VHIETAAVDDDDVAFATGHRRANAKSHKKTEEEEDKDGNSEKKLLDSVRKSLAANQKFQSTVRAEIVRIGRRKAENRAQAQRLFRRSVMFQRMVNASAPRPRQDFSSTHSEDIGGDEPSIYRHAHAAPFFSSRGSFDHEGGTGGSDDVPGVGDRRRTCSEPEPNPDAVHRLSLLRSTFVASTHPPWSAQESKSLQNIVAYHQHLVPGGQDKDRPVDYEHVAMQLAPASASQPAKSSTKSKRMQALSSSRATPRTARECELRYRSTQKRAAWTKAESLRLVELAYGGRLAWTEIASRLSGATRTTGRTDPPSDGPATAGPPSLPRRHHPRTAWECFVQYQTQLRPRPSLQWTPQQDQLLLRYVAAAGPQCVWNNNVASTTARNQALLVSASDASGHLLEHLSTALLPDKTRSQILQRIHHTLVNPKLSSDPWTADEERKLVICLKMYHDYYLNEPSSSSVAAVRRGAAAPPEAAAVTKALNAIAEHHLAHRSPKSVADKWKKSLDPGHSSLPFTDDEDAELVRVASANPSTGWAELCRAHFPSRHPERVAKRWAEVATNEQILERERRSSGGAAAGSAAMRRIPAGGGRKRKQPGESSHGDGTRNEALLTAEDFCVQLKFAEHLGDYRR
jgi:hypothetical protein